jgi:hypothetical protein
MRKLKEENKRNYSVNWRPQILAIVKLNQKLNGLKIIPIAEQFRKAQGLFIIGILT